MSDANSNKKNVRARAWVAIVYPDSAPENWQSKLDELSVPWCESPLHDKDIDGDGQPKKAHYHILLYFSGKKSYSQICDMIAFLNCPTPQVCSDIDGNVRYMAHIDSPHKYQYPVSSIKGHNGFDVAKRVKANTSARYDYIGEMIDFIAEKHVDEFMDFLVYCNAKHKDDWYPLLCDNSAVIIRECIKSNRHRGHRDFIDYDTGEIIKEDDRITE